MRSYDSRAVAAGTLCLVGGGTALLAAGAPLDGYVLLVLLTGVVVGLVSDNYRDEGIDAVLAGVLGPSVLGLAVVALTLAVHLYDPATVSGVRVLVVFMLGFGYTFVAVPFVAAIAGAVAMVTGRARHRYAGTGTQ